jgi:uncharacterized peroxidase-related enzyme
MRLPSIVRGDRRAHRVVIAVSRFFGAEIDDVAKVAMHRPAFFGAPFIALVREALRGPSTWTSGEREVFAAVVSRANECAYCVGTHAEIAQQLLGVDAIRSWEDGSYGPRVTAACRFIEKATREPENLGPEDARAAFSAGVSRVALAEAMQVAFVFNVINRIANALDFSYPSDKVRVRGASMLRRMGYRLPAFLMR